MEFERAIYRVYERSMEGLLTEEESNSQSVPFYKQSCRLFEYLVLLFGFLLLSLLFFLHFTYVGSKGCLPEALTVLNTTTNQTTLRQFSSDSIVYLTIDPDYLRKKGFLHNQLISDDSQDDYAVDNHNSNEIISPRRGNKFSQIGMNQVSHPSDFYNHILRNAPENTNFGQLILLQSISSLNKLYSYHSIALEFVSNLLFLPITPALPRSLVADTSLLLQSNETTNTTTTQNHTNSQISPYQQPFDYVLTFDWAVTILGNDLREKHHFELINITLPGYQCFGSSFAESMLTFGGIDRAILNNIIFTIKKNGYLWTKYGDLYHWNMADITPYNSFANWIGFKVNILWYSCLAFFLLSTTTALLVRILISSGVIIIFPIFWLMQCAGMNAINLRILSISYPWIGIPLQMIQYRNQSVYPFLIAHFVKVVLYYLLYIAAQSVYLRWLYNGTTFIQGQLWLYAVMMIWEYFSMIYVRAEGSIILFPRASLALFLIFHFYYYSFQSGFHLLALIIMFVFLIYIMTYCIRRYEIKAFRQGLVNMDQPRMLFNSLPWPSWRAELSPEYTLFMPVNQRSTTIYQNQVPALHPENNGTDATTNGTGTASANAANDASNPDQAGVAARGNNIEMSALTPNSTSTGSDSFIVVSDIENRVSSPLSNSNSRNPLNQLSSSQTPLNFLSRFFPSTNYQSINTSSSHHSEGITSDTEATNRESGLRTPLTEVQNVMHSPAIDSLSIPPNQNNNRRNQANR